MSPDEFTHLWTYWSMTTHDWVWNELMTNSTVHSKTQQSMVNTTGGKLLSPLYDEPIHLMNWGAYEFNGPWWTYQPVNMELQSRVIVDPRLVQVNEKEEVGPLVVLLLHMLLKALQLHRGDTVLIGVVQRRHRHSTKLSCAEVTQYWSELYRGDTGIVLNWVVQRRHRHSTKLSCTEETQA